MNRGRIDNEWPDTERVLGGERAASRDDLLAPPTQLVADRDAYLGQGQNDVGRRIAEDQVELFVTTDPATALQGEFAQHAPEFIALHDVGTSASLRLLASLAGAAGAKVQRLSVRKRGQGVALAVVQFVEVPLANGTPVRLYSTDINADSASRAQMARVLLGHSRLGVLMFGELPPHALVAQLAPLRESLLRGPWPNRDLLLVPLGSSAALATQGSQLAHQSDVAVHVTPQAAQPKQVWTFIGGAWNRLHGQPNGEHALPTEITRAVPKPQVPLHEAPTEPMPLARAGRLAAPPMAPLLQTQQPMPVPGATSWQAYVDRCALIKGTLSACVFDTHSMQVLAQAGGPPAAERLAQQGAALLSAMNDASRALGLGPARPEASITTTGHHLLLRPVPGHPGVALHLVLQASASNLVLARMQLERLEAPR
jgi:hypothetical protein